MSTLYVENSVGRRVTDAFAKFTKSHQWATVYQHDRHPQMQERQEQGDSWWIREATADGCAILSCDLAILDNEAERACVEEVGAQIVGFARADYNAWQMMRAIARHWPSIEEHLQASPLILSVSLGAPPDRLL